MSDLTEQIEGHVRIAGSDPEDTFTTALLKAGCNTTGPTTDGNGQPQYSSNCPGPGHRDGDHSPSLRWTYTANHAVKFTCHAGCGYDEILKALSLRSYQLKPVRYDYDYFDHQGVYRFTVRRTQSADDSKTFSQYRRGTAPDGGDEDGNGLESDEAFFWLEPMLAEKFEDARAAGAKLRLWIPEGEKDTIAIAGSGSLGDWDFVTTSPGGAKGWKPNHTNRIAEWANAGAVDGVILVCDPDSVGMQRGFQIRDSLAELAPDLAVSVIAPDKETDVADLCDRFGRNWIEQLRELSESEIAEALEEGTAASGYMTRMKLGVGAKPGRVGMAIASASDKDGPRLVLAAEIEPIEIWDGGWIVRVTGPSRDPREYVLSHADLSSKAAFDKWLVAVRIAMPPRSGYGAGEVAQSLGVWLDWAADIRQVKRTVVTEHLTWVNPRTGEPALSVGRGGTKPVWVSPESEGDTGVRWIGNDRGGCHWGREGTETDAAWAMARALTFGDKRTVAAVAGWAGAMVLSPWLGKWMPTKPGLAVIAPSGSGKTHGAARLLLQLIGCDGSSTSSVAGLRRRLAQGGVSAVQWIDDSAILDDHHLKEILRVATSQSEHTLANPDAGATATNTARLVGCVVVSAEGVAWAEEVAMQDRFLFAHPENPQARRSLRPERGDDLQWSDVQELVEEWNDVGEGAGLTVLSRWVINGITDETILDQLPEWVEAVGQPKGRGDVGAFVAAIGARAIATWLIRLRKEQGREWPGKDPSWDTSIYNSWSWLVNEADALYTEAKEQGPRFNTLVNSVIPAAVHAELAGVSGKGMTAIMVEGIDCSSETAMRSGIYEKVQMGARGEIATALPVVVVDMQDRVWVWPAGLSNWYARAKRGQAEARINGAKALSDQLATVEDNPEWANWIEYKGGGRSYPRPGVRIGKRDAGKSRAVYRRLNEAASRKVMEDG